MPATVREVASLAGVSTATVSRVLNGDPRVAPKTRERVQRAVADLGYRPSAIARSMARGRTASIGWVLDDLGNPFNAQAAQAVMRTGEARGYHTILALVGLEPGRCEEAVQFLLRQRVDGFAFGHARLREPSVDALVEEGYPVVHFNRRMRRPGVPFVGCDNYGGGAAVGRHLAALGHVRTAVIAGPRDLSTVTERVAGYRAALRSQEMRPAAVIHTGYRAGDGRAAMARILEWPRLPSAVFATTDWLALEAIECVAQRGLRVPEDMAIVGFDDIHLASHPWIRLTTVAQRVDEQAVRAAERLLDWLDGKPVSREAELFPAELIVRRTCGGGA